MLVISLGSSSMAFPIRVLTLSFLKIFPIYSFYNIIATACSIGRFEFLFLLSSITSMLVNEYIKVLLFPSKSLGEINGFM